MTHLIINDELFFNKYECGGKINVKLMPNKILQGSKNKNGIE